MVIWITGKAGSGKTTLAYKLHKSITSSVVLDGDEIRSVIKADFTDEGRINNINIISGLASLFDKQNLTPIIALISPMREWRLNAQKKFNNCCNIYVKGGSLWSGSLYEEPNNWESDIIYDWRNNTITKNNDRKITSYIYERIFE